MIENLSNSDILLIQHVKRWHMIRMKDEQSVAEHSYNVAMLTMRMLRKLDRQHDLGLTADEQLDVLEWALCHDVHEIEHGDVPSPSKVDRGLTEEMFWQTRGRSIEPTSTTRSFISLMDKTEALIYFLTHGYDGERNGKYISDYLEERVEIALLEFSAPIQDYVRDLIDEAVALHND